MRTRGDADQPARLCGEITIRGRRDLFRLWFRPRLIPTISARGSSPTCMMRARVTIPGFCDGGNT